jgi:tetratricopeptide (TPR) repeat protein
LNGKIKRDTAALMAIDHAWGLRYGDHRKMSEWANLAVELAEGERVRALAHAHLGNTERIAGRFEQARKHLDIAFRLSVASDPLLLEFRAALLENLSDFSGSLVCLRAAGRLRSEMGDIEGQAKVLTQTGHVLTEAGQHREAVRVFRAAIKAGSLDHDVVRAAVHGLAHSLARSGEASLALSILRKAKPLMDGGDAVSQLRSSWLLGRIAMVCEDDFAALANLSLAQAGFVERSLLHEACQTTLDLAVHHSRMGRPSIARQILDPVPSLLSQLGVHAEADLSSAVSMLLEDQMVKAIFHLDRVIAAVEHKSC